jgi:hypothetical protein
MTNETAGGIRRLSGRLMRWTPKTVEVTSAQVLTLNATPVTIIPAAGAGQIILPRFVAIRHNGGTAYAGIDEIYQRFRLAMFHGDCFGWLP